MQFLSVDEFLICSCFLLNWSFGIMAFNQNSKSNHVDTNLSIGDKFEGLVCVYIFPLYGGVVVRYNIKGTMVNWRPFRFNSKFLTVMIDVTVPDFRGDAECVEKVAKSGLDVFAHNIETVEELQSVVRDHRANFKQSLDVLMMAKQYAPAGTLTKTSVMLGCGETPDQVVKTMEKVREAGVDVITFGQYMRPSKRHMPVSEYITPEAFEKYQTLGMEMVCL